MPQQYPLEWPSHQRRLSPGQRKSSRFRSTRTAAHKLLILELQRFGARGVVISSDLRTRKSDGGFYAADRDPYDPGVAVYFQWSGRPHSIACDTYLTLAGNLRAVHETVKAMRAIERHGATSLLEQALSGFAALPPGDSGEAEASTEPWWDVLGLVGIGGFSIEEIASDSTNPMRKAMLGTADAVYRVRLRTSHPDKSGGDRDEMTRLNLAIAAARQALGKEAGP